MYPIELRKILHNRFVALAIHSLMVTKSAFVLLSSLRYFSSIPRNVSKRKNRLSSEFQPMYLMMHEVKNLY